MALNTDQKAAILDKTAQGKSSTSMVRDFFEEPFNGRPIVLPSQVWNEAEDIPTTAPSGMVPDLIIGVVQRKVDVSLTAVPGTTASFQSDDLIDAIPFNFGDGSYNYELKDNNNNPIAFGQNDWRLDPNTGTITFYTGVPSNMPPKVSFYKYVGTKGVGSGSGGGAGLNFIEGNNSTFEKGIGDWEAVDYRGEILGISYVGGTDFVTLDKEFPDGERVRYYNAGTTIGGLSNAGIYYLIKMDTYDYRLSTTPGGAFIDLTGVGNGYLYPLKPVGVPTPADDTIVEIVEDDVSPLNGEVSAVFTKKASQNGLAHAFKVNIPIPLGYRGNQEMVFSFVKNVAGAGNNFVKDDFVPYLIDPMSGDVVPLLDPVSITPDNLPVSTRFLSSADSVDIVVFITTAAASLRFLRVDDFTIKPLEMGSGSGSGSDDKNYVDKANRNFEAGSIGEWHSIGKQVTISSVQIVSSTEIQPLQIPFASKDGIKFKYSTGTGSGITGLTSGNIYYSVNSNGNTFSLASSPGGTPISISASGGDTGILDSLNFFPEVLPDTSGVTIETVNPLDGLASLKWSRQRNQSMTRALTCPVKMFDKVDVGQVVEVVLDYDASDVDFIYSVEVMLCLSDGTVLEALGNQDINNGIGKLRKMFRASHLADATYKIVLAYTGSDSSTNVMDLILDNPVVRRADPVSVPITQEEVIDLAGSGNITSGKIRVSKTGKTVVVSVIEALTHASASSRESAPNVIPSWALPDITTQNVSYMDTNLVSRLQVSTTGVFNVQYLTWAGTGSQQTTLAVGTTIAYTTADSTNTTQGLAVNANPRRETKFLDSNITASTSNIASLRFDDLKIGTQYKISLYMSVANNSVNNSIGGLEYTNNGVRVLNNQQEISAISGSGFTSRSRVPIVREAYFTAASTSLIANTIGSLTDRVIWGGAGNDTYNTYAILEEVVNPSMLMATPEAKMRVSGWLGFGSTNTYCGRFSDIDVDNSKGFWTRTASASLGDYWTINVKGRYRIISNAVSELSTAVSSGISVNSTNAAASIRSLTYAQGYRDDDVGFIVSGQRVVAKSIWEGVLNPNDIIRSQGLTLQDPVNSNETYFEIEFLGYVS